MFCSNCGEKFIEPNQKFCQKCGHSVKTATTAQSGSQVTIMQTQTSAPMSQPKTVYPQKSQITGEVGPHSKRSLAFGITSLGLCAVGAIIANMTTLMYFGSYYYYPYSFITALMKFIIMALILVAALVFGCLARSNGNKAELYESRNGMQKAGKIMGLLGVIFFALLAGNFVLFDVLNLDSLLINYTPYTFYAY